MTGRRRRGLWAPTITGLSLGAVLAVAAPAAAAAGDVAPPRAAAASATPSGSTGSSGATGSRGATAPGGPRGPSSPAGPQGGSVNVSLTGVSGKPSQSIVIVLLLTVLGAAPALLILCTSFTKIVVVLSLTRNALGLTNIPPNQVLAGLALFLSLFVMGPTLTKVNHDGLQPYLHGTKTQAQAWQDGSAPLRDWMLGQTRKDDIAMLTDVAAKQQAKAAAPAGSAQLAAATTTSLTAPTGATAAPALKTPASPKDLPLTTLIPAFVLSELKSAFIIGFVVFVPFLVIDLIVSSTLMSLGMMMVPPVLVSLPFKILLFVMVDGWALIVHSLVSSYH